MTTPVLFALVIVACCVSSRTPNPALPPGSDMGMPEAAPAGNTPAVGNVAKLADASPMTLSPDGRRAFETLRTTNVFQGARVYFGASVSENAAAVRALIREPAAPQAFQALFENGSAVARLYALVAFWYLRPDDFMALMESVRVRDGEREIETLDGCIGGREQVATLLRTQPSDVVRLKPGSGLYDFMCNLDAGPFQTDFGGGWVPISIVEDVTIDIRSCAAPPPRPSYLMRR